MNGLNRRAQLGVLLAILSLTGATGCRTRSFLSTKQEVNLGREGSRQIEVSYRVDTSSPDADRVRKIGQKLLPHIDKRDVPYSFKVLEEPSVNAVSLPGGPVYIFRGLLDMLGDDDDALACIIGHEIGHVNGRHAARQLSSAYATQLLLIFGVPDPNIQQVAGLGAELIGLKYSRDDEYDADRRGLSYAHYAGFDPNGIIRFFERLDRLEKRRGGGPAEWLRTHPLNTTRIQKAQTVIENKNYRYGQ
jgi:beta-barrel assembly-enhancing protease